MNGYGLNAKQRVPKYSYYWFISGSEQGKFTPCKCRETEHPFDAENFTNGNYFDNYEDARTVSRLMYNEQKQQKYKLNAMRINKTKKKKK